ncbi:ANTAR domain-containing protein [Streptomyces sp. CCNWLW237]|uniref:ANTAR domain-containing protein n=1 Tax=Streptomyces sp. CCNWLW237 TaxID=3127465 RepID=UPI00307717BD
MSHECRDAAPAGRVAPRVTVTVRGAQRGGVEERNRRLAHAGVARAQEVLVGRYRLAGPQVSFELLRQTSQRFNIRLHTLADAVTHIPGPGAGAAQWFPRRARYSPPPLTGLGVEGAERRHHGAVLRAAMRRMLHITDTGMGNVQLAENGLLRLEKHTGLNQEFTDFFAFVQDSTTACAQAAQERRQVTVKDAAVADIFDDDSRHAILQTGARGVHSLPLTSPSGAVLGMVSSHHERPLPGLSQAQLDALDTLGTQIGRWLLWHRHTVVLDALEHLHSISISARAR